MPGLKVLHCNLSNVVFKGIRSLKPPMALIFVSESCGAVRQREEANASSEKSSGTIIIQDPLDI
jgi:hypothetical protein